MTPARRARGGTRAAAAAPEVQRAIAGHEADFARDLERRIDAFRAADLYATAAHGNADAESFYVGGAKTRATNLGDLDASIDLATNHGITSGWADLARFEASLASMPELSAGERESLGKKLEGAYEEYAQSDQGGGHSMPLEAKTTREAVRAFYKARSAVDRFLAGDGDALRALMPSLVSQGAP